ncbi:hypothetical protein HHK36_012772 [Tetracentron sinense]|uniref:Pentatricopeptide repeat-containing protein n=1 Tax=Tetracentron sinense TaxID=13715 RepID=A0A834ZDH2_TETSI|nr:hypothetical protein HHK36_012772 [Tetracentron sinense]
MMTIIPRTATSVAAASFRASHFAPPKGMLSSPLSISWVYVDSAMFHSQSYVRTQFENSVRNQCKPAGFSKLEDALGLFNRAVEMRPFPSISAFNQLLGEIAKMKHYHNVFSLYKVMNLIEISPDVATLSILINCFKGGFGFLRLRKHPETWCSGRWRKEVVSIDSMCKDRLVTEALELFLEMTGKGIPPNVVTYSCLIHGLYSSGEWKKAIRLFNEMLDRKISPDVDALCKEGMTAEAEGVLKVMIQRGEEPDTVTTLINGYCKGRMIDEAMWLFREMCSQGLMPDTITYSTLISGLFQTGRVVAAREFFNEMQARGQCPDIFTYNIMLDGLCKNQCLAEAIALLYVIQDRKLEPTIVTYGILIDGMCKAGKLKSAMELFYSLPSKGLQPNVNMYNIIINGLCKEGLLDEANEFLVKMEKNGCSPDDVTFNTILQGFLQKNQNLEAMQLLRNMFERGFWPCESIVSMLELLFTEAQDYTFLKMLQKIVPNDKKSIPVLKCRVKNFKLSQ